jgi:hypothetical protein
MPRFDECHEQVVRALKKEDWQVNKSRRISSPERDIFIDIRAEKQRNGTRLQILLAEVKCFPETAVFSSEFYAAIGQYLFYQVVLEGIHDKTPLYLVMPYHIYQTEFDATIQRVITKYQVKMIIVNLETEEIVKWIE